MRGLAVVEGHNPFFSRGGLSKTWPEGHIMYNSFPQKLAKASLFSKCIFSLGPSNYYSRSLVVLVGQMFLKGS